MKYEILKDFKGSQAGSVVEDFKQGEIRELSNDLANCVVPEGWAEAVKESKAVVAAPKNKAVGRPRKNKVAK